MGYQEKRKKKKKTTDVMRGNFKGIKIESFYFLEIQEVFGTVVYLKTIICIFTTSFILHVFLQYLNNDTRNFLLNKYPCA